MVAPLQFRRSRSNNLKLLRVLVTVIMLLPILLALLFSIGGKKPFADEIGSLSLVGTAAAETDLDARRRIAVGEIDETKNRFETKGHLDVITSNEEEIILHEDSKPSSTATAVHSDVKQTNATLITSRTAGRSRGPRNVVLFGPHDRFNFGDLLFTKVLVRLLETRAGYGLDEILFGGIVPFNMTRYGGEGNILSMKTLQKMSQEDTIKGPYDIVYTGGESAGCSHGCAARMIMPPGSIELAKKEKIYECGYFVPKSFLVPPSQMSKPTNRAVVNSVGGIARATSACRAVIDSADYVAYRDSDPLYPDSAVMTKDLYETEIRNVASEVLKEIFSSSDGAQHYAKKIEYIAVQHLDPRSGKRRGTKPRVFDNFTQTMASSLDRVSTQSNATIVFFVAGTAPGHDSFAMYNKVASLMEQPSIVYQAEDVWKTVAIISQAEAVLSTSLHVRIMAFIYGKPRITWCKEQKHRKFISLWDADDSPRCLNNMSRTWSILRKYYGPDPEITQNKTAMVYDEMVRKYLESFDKWSSLLRNIR